MTSNLYDERYLKATLNALSDELDELLLWSAYNEDIKLEEIQQLEDLFKTIKQQLIK